MNDLEGKFYVLDATHLKLLSLASLVNLGTRFLLRGVVLSHPEIFEFQDVIKNKTTIFS